MGEQKSRESLSNQQYQHRFVMVGKMPDPLTISLSQPTSIAAGATTSTDEKLPLHVGNSQRAAFHP